MIRLLTKIGTESSSDVFTVIKLLHLVMLELPKAID